MGPFHTSGISAFFGGGISPLCKINEERKKEINK
jgi:hypothetical protein